MLMISFALLFSNKAKILQSAFFFLHNNMKNPDKRNSQNRIQSLRVILYKTTNWVILKLAESHNSTSVAESSLDSASHSLSWVPSPNTSVPEHDQLDPFSTSSLQAKPIPCCIPSPPPPPPLQQKERKENRVREQTWRLGRVTTEILISRTALTFDSVVNWVVEEERVEIVGEERIVNIRE